MSDAVMTKKKVVELSDAAMGRTLDLERCSNVGDEKVSKRCTKVEKVYAAMRNNV